MKAALVDVIGRMNRIRPLPADADRPGHPDRRRRQRFERLAVVVLRAAAARHEGTDRELSALHRRRDQAAHRIGARRRVGQRQRGSARRRAHHGRSRQGRRDGHRHSGYREPRDRSDRRFRRTGRESAGASTRCASPAATNPRISASSCSPGAMAGRSSSAMSRRSRLKPPEQQFFVYQNGNPAIGLQVLRAPGANVLGTLEQVKKVVEELRDGPAEGTRARHRAEFRFGALHPSRGQSPDRKPRSSARCWRSSASGGSCATGARRC